MKIGGERFIPSLRAEEKRDYEYDGGSNARVKSQKYWAGKLQRFTQQNNNDGTAAPMAQSLSYTKERPTKKQPYQRIRRGIAEAATVY